MKTPSAFRRQCCAFLTSLLAGLAAAQLSESPLEIKLIAEVESASSPRKLVSADRVVPGDRVIYTLEIRNAAPTAMDAPSVTYPIPEHMRYIADSAVGPGAAVSYSIDGGRSFERAENLKVRTPEGRLRPAAAADYTDIRWQIKNSLRPNSVAYVRFRALVK
ncbi:MAG TPA: hypothetical protein VGO37_12475 [Steroidobacteraceae bacterium]|jgi:uncharacterized repeat protein (TIGR01451 family)|nr:hypothetical protein [Steroidobacteraceae bacterium]